MKMFNGEEVPVTTEEHIELCRKKGLDIDKYTNSHYSEAKVRNYAKSLLLGIDTSKYDKYDLPAIVLIVLCTIVKEGQDIPSEKTLAMLATCETGVLMSVMELLQAGLHVSHDSIIFDPTLSDVQRKKEVVLILDSFKSLTTYN